MCGPRRQPSCGSGGCGGGHGGFQQGQQGFQGPQRQPDFQQPQEQGHQRPIADDTVPAPDFENQSANLEGEEDLSEAAKAGKQIFLQSCRKCHTSEKGDLPPFTQWKKEHWEMAIDAVESGSMPKNNPGSIKGEELEKLKAFFKSQIPKETKPAEVPEPQEPEAQKPEARAPEKPHQAQIPSSGQSSAQQGPAPQTPAQESQSTSEEAPPAPDLSSSSEDERERSEVQLSQRRREGLIRLQSNYLKPKRTETSPTTAPKAASKAPVSGLDKAMDRVIDRLLIQELDPMKRYRTGEVEAPDFGMPGLFDVRPQNPFGPAPFRRVGP